MPTTLSTTLSKIEYLPNAINATLLRQYMVSNGASERHQNNSLKMVIAFATYLPAIRIAAFGSSVNNEASYSHCHKCKSVTTLDGANLLDLNGKRHFCEGASLLFHIVMR
ncbi:MAG: hypothetical protein WA667_13905 [Candidatus Nitrosopolaris sp.]